MSVSQDIHMLRESVLLLLLEANKGVSDKLC